MSVSACERMQCCSGGGASPSEFRARVHHPRGTCPHPRGSRWGGLDAAAARLAACAACEYAVLTAAGGAETPGGAAAKGMVPAAAGGGARTPAAPGGPAGALVARLLARVTTCRGCDEYDDALGPELGECAELADGELRRRWSDLRAGCPRGYWSAIDSSATAAARPSDEQVRA